jgi:hypothetical protein
MSALTAAVCLAVGLLSTAAAAQDATRALQDPLAYISAVVNENTITFDQGDDKDQTGYDFQFQPVYSMQTDRGYSFIPRAVIPINGQPSAGNGTEWGLGDVILQSFFAPSTDRAVKWGLGPQLSLRSRSNSALGGPGWGGGLAGVVVYSNGPWSTAGIVNHLWGQDDFSVTNINPIAYYNFPSGWFLAYSNNVSYNWQAARGQEWTVPIGLSTGRGIDLGGGYALEVLLGAYKLVERPDGAGEYQIKFGLSTVFPR